MNDRYYKALKNIQSIVNAYKFENITITIGNDDHDAFNHIYDLRFVFGLIENHLEDAFREDNYYKKGGPRVWLLSILGFFRRHS